MLNSVALVGRLVRDPDTISTNGTTRATFTLAVQRTYTPKGKEKMADYIPIKAWGKTAELVQRFCTRGMQVGIEGSLQQRTWEDESGKKHGVLEVQAERVHFLEPKGERTTVSQGSPEDFSEISLEDDLPF